MNTYVHTKKLYTNIPGSIIHDSQKVAGEDKCSSTDEWINIVLYISTMKYISAMKIIEVLMHAMA